MIATAAPHLPAHPPPVHEPVAGNYFVAVYPPFSAWDSEQVSALHKALERPAPEKPLGIYVHLPFCQKKCDYCYYLSYIAQPAVVVDQYLETVVRELALYSERPGVKGRPLSFVYFGGGTPSSLSSTQVRYLMDGLRRELAWDGIEEVTFECAPRSVRWEFLEALRDSGVTRLSMGVQSFDDELLRLNGRVHLAEDVVRAYSLIRQADFAWVNLDLMCGLLGETEAQWRESVRRVIELAPDGVTIYQTEIPHNTQLYRDVKAGGLPVAPLSWDTKRARLDEGFRELERAGYTVVSGYNEVKDPQRHRFLYQDYLWRGTDMLGLGVAAFGYFGGVQAQNEVTLEEYEAAVARGEVPVKRAIKLSARDQLVREFVLQLKLGEVPVAPFRARFGVILTEVFAEPLQALAAEGWLTWTAEAVQLTRPGLLRVDRLLSRFYDPQFQRTRYT
ncbi:MAG: coproporphyrinogen III oxidase family protein [Verrucomicrobia subdivision 3 bacterium]|nr:coproporphyrinogen III oxidase family protein [Limisphaerales bacterium]